MINEIKAMALIRAGGIVRRDLCISNSGLFKVIDGLNVSMFPIILLKHLVERGLLEFRAVEGCCSYYRLVRKRKEA